MSFRCSSQSELSISWIFLTLFKGKGFSEINLKYMEPQNQVRVETLFPTFFFQSFWIFSHVDGVKGRVTLPPRIILMHNSGISVATSFLVFEAVPLLVSCSLCMLS